MKKKCIAWDLDDTLWDGVCLEGEVRLRPEALKALEELDRRGVLHCIASRGDEQVALRTLRSFDLDHLFVAHRINWSPKPANIRSIATELGLPVEAFVFIDDDPFEREQVEWVHPQIGTVDATEVSTLSSMPSLRPEFLTPEGARRRELYLEEASRCRAGGAFATPRAFLEGCNMRLTVRSMQEGDIPRVLELMTRTHQLNTSGRIFDREQVVEEQDDIWVASLSDRFGDYGIVGVAVVDRKVRFRLTYLAVSCRVMGRGVVQALLATLLETARRDGFMAAEALVRTTETNRAMRVLYQMSGFRRAEELQDGTLLYQAAAETFPTAPSWLEVCS